MKKVMFMASLAVLAVGATSCLGSDGDSATIRTDMVNYIENIVDDKEAPVLTSAVCEFNVDYSKSVIQSSVRASKDGLSVSFVTEYLPMETGTTCYEFGQKQISLVGQTINNYMGFFDPNPGCMVLNYTVDNTYRVYSTASLAYNFANMLVYDEKFGPEIFSTKNVGFAIYPDCAAKTALFKMVGFSLTELGTKLTLIFDGVPYTLERDGIIMLNSDSLKAIDENGVKLYDATEFKMVCDMRTNSANVGFVVDGKFVELYGNIFSSSVN